MMFRYPYFRPFYHNMNRNMHFSNINTASADSFNNINHIHSMPLNITHGAQIENSSFDDESRNANKKQNPCEDSEVFNILGVSLHTDDVLIIGLLIFLYIQEIDDPYLFICLILLLLS